MELIYTKNDSQKLYKIDIELLDIQTEKWEFNRPADTDRVNQIKETIDSNKEVGDPIHLAKIEGKDKYQCWDGNHRREAYILYANELIENDLATQDDNIEILAWVHSPITEEQLKEKFKILNKANPVPELYMSTSILNNELRLASIKNIIKRILSDRNFKKHKSLSNNPRKPNFNVTNLSNNLLRRLENVEFNEEQVYRKILEVNDRYKQNQLFIEQLSESCKKKCLETGCYIFCKTDFTENLVL